MASKNKNLSSFSGKNLINISAKKIGVVVSEWNSEITEALYSGAVETLLQSGASQENIIRKTVPGSYELTLGAQWLAKRKDIDAVICLGCVIQGETPHFDYICQAVANGITNVSLKYDKPVIFGVLTTIDHQQALERAGGKHGNKGDGRGSYSHKNAWLLRSYHTFQFSDHKYTYIMKILKFGGTSVGQPSRMHQVGNIVTSQKGPKIVVLSALSGTTNALVKIGEALTSGKKDQASSEIEALYEHYLTFQSELVQKDNSLAKSNYVINEHFSFIRSLVKVTFNEHYTKELLAQGELMSTKLFSIYLEEVGHRNILLPALEFMAINDNDEPDMDFIQSRLSEILSQSTGNELFITQGYICLNAQQQIDNLKRGGSDYTASLIGAAINAEKIEIWTDIDGMHNNDPRMVERTIPVAELSFDEASELAYFGAKILHPSSILPAKQYNVPVQLKNTMDSDAAGTLISGEEKTKEIKAIAAKDGITAIKIKSTRMLLAYGFLSEVFAVFEKYKTPIDMITTSEVAVSLTIDDDSRLQEIIEDLTLFGAVTVDTDQSIICMVGNDVVEEKGIIKNIFDALEEIPIRMISYGGSKYNVSVLTESKFKKKALIALNKGIFNL